MENNKIYLIVIFVFLCLLSLLECQNNKIKELRNEVNTEKSNVSTLLQDVLTYKTKDSLNAAKIGSLELSLSDYKKYRQEDLRLIETLKTKNSDLESVATTQTETIVQVNGNVKDSIIIIKNDTIEVEVEAKCVDIVQPYIELHGCILPNNGFTGTIVSRDSLLITETVKYKRFLGFLWKTKKIKNREFDIVSKNPHTNILDFEVITIKK
jgi:predicted Holliday junction resolvase-like endonuclease